MASGCGGGRSGAQNGQKVRTTQSQAFELALAGGSALGDPGIRLERLVVVRAAESSFGVVPLLKLGLGRNIRGDQSILPRHYDEKRQVNLAGTMLRIDGVLPGDGLTLFQNGIRLFMAHKARQNGSGHQIGVLRGAKGQ